MASKLRYFAAFIFAFCSVYLVGCTAVGSRPETEQAAEKPLAVDKRAEERLFFGNISKATTDPANKDNYLMFKSSAAISYNNSRGTANWITWQTTRSDLGDRLDRPDFAPDADLPRGFRRIVHSDYSGSGYQRGHLLPSADRFGNVAQNAETFLMTNIVPQLGDLNENPWEKFESYLRSQAWRGKDVYQIAGAYGSKERLKGRVTVPTNCWKIAAIVDAGTLPSDIPKKTRFIAVDMPNKTGIAEDSWQKYRTSIRKIEDATGYDLFNFLDRGLQDSFETAVDNR